MLQYPSIFFHDNHRTDKSKLIVKFTLIIIITINFDYPSVETKFYSFYDK